MSYRRSQKVGLSTALFFAIFLALTSYFVFAAIQGDYGHIKRIQVESEEKRLSLRLKALKLEKEQLKNKPVNWGFFFKKKTSLSLIFLLMFAQVTR